MADVYHIKNGFGHISAADCRFQWNFAWASSFPHTRDTHPRSTERILVFIMQFGLPRAAHSYRLRCTCYIHTQGYA